MILSGIFSVSGDQPLVSGGEYFIKATQNGAELKLVSASHVLVSSTQKGVQDKNMQVFYANNMDENTTWGSPTITDTVKIGIDFTNIFYYAIPVNNLHWVNCDHFLNVPGIKTDVKATINGSDNNNNTKVFVSFDSLNSASLFSFYSNPYFTSSIKQLPIGLKVTFVALSKINGNYFSAFQSTTIIDNHIENLTLSPTIIDDFKLQLDTLH